MKVKKVLLVGALELLLTIGLLAIVFIPAGLVFGVISMVWEFRGEFLSHLGELIYGPLVGVVCGVVLGIPLGVANVVYWLQGGQLGALGFISRKALELSEWVEQEGQPV